MTRCPDSSGAEVLDLGAFRDAVSAAPRAVLSTVGEHGGPQSALLDLAVTESGHLLLNTIVPSRKLDSIRRDPRVAVVIGLDAVSLQIEGVAELPLSEDDRRAWGDAYRDAFPGARVHVRGFEVIRIGVRWLRLYDTRPDPARVLEGEPSWGIGGASIA